MVARCYSASFCVGFREEVFIMDEFIKRFLQLRDGNHLPQESYVEKCMSGRQRWFELSFVSPIDVVTHGMFQDALLAAAESGAVYARFHFRYVSDRDRFVACNRALDHFFFPLQSRDVCGRALPLCTIEPKEGMWTVELYPIEAVPEQDVLTITQRDLFRAMLGVGHPGGRSKQN